MGDRWNLSDQVDEIMRFRTDRDWEQFHRPKELAAGLSIEAAELQELFLWKEGETSAEVSRDSGRMKQITAEIADITIHLLMLSYDLGIDLREAISGKLEQNEQRYPISEYRGSAEKAPHHPTPK